MRISTATYQNPDGNSSLNGGITDCISLCGLLHCSDTPKTYQFPTTNDNSSLLFIMSVVVGPTSVPSFTLGPRLTVPTWTWQASVAEGGDSGPPVGSYRWCQAPVLAPLCPRPPDPTGQAKPLPRVLREGHSRRLGDILNNECNLPGQLHPPCPSLSGLL